MAPSEGCDGDPAAGEGSTRSFRSGRMGPTIIRYFGDRPAAAPTAGECDADGVEEEEEERRGYYPNPAPRRPTPAAPTAGEGESRWLGKRVALEETSVQEAVPRCARCRHPSPRRPRPFGEGTSAAGAEEAVLTCGGYGDAAPRRPTPVGAGLGHEGGVARCGFRIPTLAPGSDPTPCAQMGPAASCILVASGGRGGGGGRGHMDSHDYDGTSRPPAFNLAPTSDLAPKDKVTAEMECMEEGYLAKIVQGYDAKEIKVGEVICVNVEEDYKPSAADAPAAPSESKATPEPAVPKVGEKVPAKANNEVQLSSVKGNGPDGHILKADIEDYLDAPAAPSESKATPEPAGPKVEEKVPAKANNEVQLSSVKGNGPDGHILKADIEDYLDAPAAPSGSKATPEPAEPKVEEKVPAKANNVSLGGVNGNSTCRRMLINRVPSAVTGLNGSLSCGRVASASSFSSCAASVAKGGKSESFAASGLDYTDIPNAQIRKNDKTRPPEITDECIKFGPVDNDKVFGLNVKSMLGEIDSSELPEFIDGSFICSDKGGCLGSNKRTLKDHYVTKMNLYLRAGSMSDDMMLISDGEESNNYSFRYEELKDFKNFSNNTKGLTHLRQKIDYYTEGKQGVGKHFCTSPLSTYDESESENKGYFCALCVSCKNMKKRRDETQLFVDLCGSSISLQKNLNTSNVNMLMEAACAKAGLKSNDCYSTFSGKVLAPEKLLSYYHIKRDCTIRVNPRIRGGKLQTIDFETWDDKINACDRHYTVTLPPELLAPFNRTNSINSVKYLSKQLRYWSKQVLIGLCRKHFRGISFDGDFTSAQLLFEDGNFRFDNSVPIKQYNRTSALLDYAKISQIFQRAFRTANGLLPMHSFHLLNFLLHPPQSADPQSEAVTAFLCNHYCLLSYSDRIKVSESLDTLLRMLVGDDYKNFAQSIGNIGWIKTIKTIPVMNDVYLYHAEYDKFNRITYIPYFNNSVSLLHFSNNFFKHADYSPEQLEAAFSLVMRSFIPNLLRDSVIAFMYHVTPCPLVVEKFINEVTTMLGEVTVGCVKIAW